MINLNKRLVSKEGILEYLKETDVFSYYANKGVDMSGNMLSPLRDEEKPSFGYFVGQSGEICFNDFVLGTGDFIRFVELMFGLTFFEALSQIATDFNLTSKFECKVMKKNDREAVIQNNKVRDSILHKVNTNNKIGVSRRPWAAYDLAYWHRFGVTKQMLIYYNIQPISYIFFSPDKPGIKADKYAYVYNEFKDGEHTMKIYQPFSKDFKWLNNHNDSIWQGWAQLPKNGESLIITKSLKDAMSIYATTGVPSVALQSESVNPKQHVLDELDSRFETVYLLYDDDFDKDYNIGEVLGAKLVEDQPIIQLTMPRKYLCKDFSDLVKKHGTETAKEIYKTEIELPY
tara:strand:+ start:23532 stop:24563 length:1032 start_codon:yes stop_codon:yes gene_type:complete